MSKLEDKLSASIKPAARSPSAKARQARPAASGSGAAKPTAGSATSGDLNAPVPDLHPARIWPD